MSSSAAPASGGFMPVAVADGIRNFFADCPQTAATAATSAALSSFLARVPSHGRVVCVTSGGTLAPLERRTVRFVDNFSTGARGAAMVERLLSEQADQNVFVIFLHRTASALPFMRRVASHLTKQAHAPHTASLNSCATLAALRVQPASADAPASLQLDLGADSTGASSVLSSLFSFASSRHRFLPLEFSSVEDYMVSLRAVCLALRPFGRRGGLLLAAAVSDYHIPRSQMSEHKLDSRAGTANLQLTMEPTPKMLHALRHDMPPATVATPDAVSASSSASAPSTSVDDGAWLPSAFVCSFKLETDSSLLVRKSRAALAAYGVNAVLANELATRYEEMRIIAQPGDESDPNAGVEVVRRAGGYADEFAGEVEVELVRRLTAMHQQWIDQQARA